MADRLQTKDGDSTVAHGGMTPVLLSSTDTNRVVGGHKQQQYSLELWTYVIIVISKTRTIKVQAEKHQESSNGGIWETGLFDKEHSTCCPSHVGRPTRPCASMGGQTVCDRKDKGDQTPQSFWQATKKVNSIEGGLYARLPSTTKTGYITWFTVTKRVIGWWRMSFGGGLYLPISLSVYSKPASAQKEQTGPHVVVEKKISSR